MLAMTICLMQHRCTWCAERQLVRLKQEDEAAFDEIYKHIPHIPLDRDGKEQESIPGMMAFLKTGCYLGLCQPADNLSGSNAAKDP